MCCATTGNPGSAIRIEGFSLGVPGCAVARIHVVDVMAATLVLRPDTQPCLRSVCRISHRCPKRPCIYDEILLPNRLTLVEALKDLKRSCGVASLRRQGSAGNMRGHAVKGHRPPRMIGRGRLRIPDIACISGQLSRLKGAHHSVAVNEFAACSVDEIGATLHMREHLVIKEMLGRRIERHLQIDDIHCLHQGHGIRMVGKTKLALDLFAEPMRVGVVEMQAERVQPT